MISSIKKKPQPKGKKKKDLKINLRAIATILGKEGHRMRQENVETDGENRTFYKQPHATHRQLISNILNSGHISRLLPKIRYIIGKWGIKKIGSNEEKLFAFGLHFSTF